VSVLTAVPSFTGMALAGPDPNMPLNDDTVTPGILGFAVFLGLAVAVVFLIRSMNKQMGKIQAPREADLKQQEWERAEAAKRAKADTEDEPEDEPEADTEADTEGKAESARRSENGPDKG
jgi:flagellar biosynthesis/type III secretory pathway M-ring protein FliF/YscJ